MTYDALGRRVTYAPGASTTHYVYDQTGNPIVELDSGGVVQAVYAVEPAQYDLTQPDVQVWDPLAGQLVQRNTPSLADFDRPLAQVRSGSVYYYHVDYLGSVWGITDTVQATVRTYTYGPFGEMNSQTGALVNPYTYTGREWDAATELHYYRARHYDTALGRFLQRDAVAQIIEPAENMDGVNLYIYVANDPLIATDPTGAFVTPLCPLAILACGMLGALFGLDDAEDCKCDRANEAAGYAVVCGLGCVAACGPFFGLCIASYLAAYGICNGAAKDKQDAGGCGGCP